MDLTREQIRAIIYYEFLDTKDYKEIHARITRRLGDTIISISAVKYWINEFKRGRQSLKDDPRSGRPITTTTDENIDAIRELLRSDPRITFDELEEKSGISRGSLQKILHESLRVQKKFCRFVPHRLSEEQKRERIRICTENLKMWRNCGQSLIDKIITENEVYVHYYEPKSRNESKIWVFEDETPPQVVKRDKTVGKVLYAVFFNTSGLVEAVKLEGQKSVTSLWFTTKCLPRVFQNASRRGLMLHMDNASSHTANLTLEYLAEKKVKVVPHPAYSPDVAMCDFWLFAGLKRNLRGRSFSSEEELDLAVLEYFESIPKDRWRAAFDMWRNRMVRCIEAKGEYFD
jgi:histone-lysine N-methyltransferase SETMAR